MSNSLIFCKSVASDPSRSNFLDRDFRHADEFGDTRNMLKNLLGDKRGITISGKDESGKSILFDVTIDFDPNAKFDYCTSEAVVHDGTYIFMLQAIEGCLMKVITGSTYYSKCDPPTPGSSVHYTIGNAVVLNEYDTKFATKEKPWMQERTTVMLPIKYEVMK